MKEDRLDRTQSNLIAAVTAECVDAAKYALYAGIAQAEGLGTIARLFEAIAGNEREHAEIWLKHLKGGLPQTTRAALEDAIKGENYTRNNYARFAADADAEGLTEMSRLFREVAEIEQQHEAAFARALDEVKTDSVYDKNRSVTWKCGHCGHEHFGESAPGHCPVCGHEREGFSVKCE